MHKRYAQLATALATVCATGLGAVHATDKPVLEHRPKRTGGVFLGSGRAVAGASADAENQFPQELEHPDYALVVRPRWKSDVLPLTAAAHAVARLDAGRRA